MSATPLPKGAPAALYWTGDGDVWLPEEVEHPDGLRYPVVMYVPAAVSPSALHEFPKPETTDE